MRKIEKQIAISLAISLSAITFQPREARSNPALVAAPAACATGVGCVLVGVAIVGGIGYAVWQNQKGKHYVMIEDPDEHNQWGVYRAKGQKECHRLAAGREWYWRNGKCYIKG